MEIKVIRKTLTDKSTTGDLLIDGRLFCHTLEDIVRPGAKVFGETAIPEGNYKLVISYSNRFKKLMPEVVNVPGFQGIRIHCGNTDADTHGCLLVGDELGHDFLGKSKIAYERLYPIIETALKTQKVTIQYVNQF